MAIDPLRDSLDEPVTRRELNKVIAEINLEIVTMLAEVGALARVSKGVVTDSSGGTATNSVAVVPAAYDRAYFQATLATILNRINDLVRVNLKLANLA